MDGKFRADLFWGKDCENLFIIFQLFDPTLLSNTCFLAFDFSPLYTLRGAQLLRTTLDVVVVIVVVVIVLHTVHSNFPAMPRAQYGLNADLPCPDVLTQYAIHSPTPI